MARTFRVRFPDKLQNWRMLENSTESQLESTIWDLWWSLWLSHRVRVAVSVRVKPELGLGSWRS